MKKKIYVGPMLLVVKIQQQMPLMQMSGNGQLDPLSPYANGGDPFNPIVLP